MKGKLCVLMGLAFAIALAAACSPSPPTEKQALQACQDVAMGRMAATAGNPRYRNHKTEITALETGPENYKYRIKGEYFYKAVHSGDSELRFTCTISKRIDADQWTTDAFDAVCIGGCS